MAFRQENMKGGAQQRQRTGSATLTAEEVRVIKRLLREAREGYGDGRYLGPRAIAQMYQVGTETIRRIDRGDTWGWLEAEERPLVEMTPGLIEAAKKSGEELLRRLGEEEKIEKPVDIMEVYAEARRGPAEVDGYAATARVLEKETREQAGSGLMERLVGDINKVKEGERELDNLIEGTPAGE